MTVNDKLSEEVKADRRARSEYLRQFEGPVAEMSNAANNAYLKANQQQDGTRSYGRMVDLLLAEARQEAEQAQDPSGVAPASQYSDCGARRLRHSGSRVTPAARRAATRQKREPSGAGAHRA